MRPQIALLSAWTLGKGDAFAVRLRQKAIPMSPVLDLTHQNSPAASISPMLELGAYEALWDEERASFKTIAEKFAKAPGAVPSDLVATSKAEQYAEELISYVHRNNITRFGVRVHGAGEYPPGLRDAKYPLELLYFRGWWDLVFSPSIAVVGSRNPSQEGAARTRALVRKLVADDYTIVSGMAAGIDKIAHETAMEENGRTIAVLGTPITQVYPRENTELQERIANAFLVISQVPVKRYARQTSLINKHFFPERNITMSALTEATIIVEAGETSGTLVQARAAIAQRRKLFVLDSCFLNPKITWPQKFAEKGAIRVKTYDDIKRHLSSAKAHAN